MSDFTVAAPARATKTPALPAKRTQNPKPAPHRRCAAPEVGETTERAADLSSLIVLTLRPNGQKFNGNRIERAQEAGFDKLENVGAIGYKCCDTGREIARFIVDNMDEALGKLREIKFRLDLTNCVFEYGLGKSLIKKLSNYAILIGGHICDGLGTQLGDEELSAIADHINAVTKARRAAERKARVVTLPTGEKRELSELSFVYDVLREAGSRKASYRGVYFDAPALNYYEGRALGMQMAGEVVQFFRNHKTEKLRLDCILRELFEKSESNYGVFDKADVANVGNAFMEVISELIEIGARKFNQKWLDLQIAKAKLDHEEFMQDREARKAEFVARMKAARQAKQKGRNV